MTNDPGRKIYTVILHPNASKNINKIKKENEIHYNIIWEELKKLKHPYDYPAFKKLSGTKKGKSAYRIKIKSGSYEENGDIINVAQLNYRVVFIIEDNKLIVLITDIGDRKKFYKNAYYKKISSKIWDVYK